MTTEEDLMKFRGEIYADVSTALSTVLMEQVDKYKLSTAEIIGIMETMKILLLTARMEGPE